VRENDGRTYVRAPTYASTYVVRNEQ
jgi:hypothetical protein